MSALGYETIRVRHEATRDDYGNPMDPGDPVTYEGCVVAPRTSTEQTDRQDTVIVGLTAYVPLDGDPSILSTDEIEWARRPDVWYKVVGEPGPWYYLDGTPAGLQVALVGATG